MIIVNNNSLEDISWRIEGRMGAGGNSGGGRGGEVERRVEWRPTINLGWETVIGWQLGCGTVVCGILWPPIILNVTASDHERERKRDEGCVRLGCGRLWNLFSPALWRRGGHFMGLGWLGAEARRTAWSSLSWRCRGGFIPGASLKRDFHSRSETRMAFGVVGNPQIRPKIRWRLAAPGAFNDMIMRNSWQFYEVLTASRLIIMIIIL